MARTGVSVALGTMALLVGLAAAGAGGAAAPSAAAPAASLEPVRVFVSVLPQAWFVQRVGGPRVEVHVLVGPGQSPHTFEPTPRQMAALATARLFFTTGWPFETQVLEKARSIHPALEVIDLRQGIPLRRFTGDETGQGGEDKDEGRRAGEPDPHIWLSPRLAAIQAARIAQVLTTADPDRAAEFQKNLETLQDDLRRTDERLARALAPLRGQTFFVFHPAFGYFADAYGLRQRAVEVEGKEPTARQLADLIDKARAAGVRVIFVQPQFSAKSAEAVARAIQGAVVPMDDLAQDYLANLEAMADKIVRALQPETPARGDEPAASGKDAKP